jgi:hypothetical protein
VLKAFVFGLCVTILAACGSDGSSGTGGSGGATGAGGNMSGLPSCDDVCTKVVAAACPAGPGTQADCVAGCQMIRAGKCAGKYQELADCAGPNPTYTCGASGAVTVVGCESADGALTACLSTP